VRVEATLQDALPPTRARTHFQPAWLEARPQGLIAMPLHVQKAANFPPQTLANGLICRPPESPACMAGERVWVDVIDSLIPPYAGAGQG
jgi:molybdopterin biosynthesis enzyme